MGADPLYFLDHSHSVNYIDISTDAVNLVKNKVEEKKFTDKFKAIQLDMSEDNIPLEDESIDILYSRLALHYFYKDRTTQILREINRVLVKGGKAYITVKSLEDKKEMEFLKKTGFEIEPNVFKDGDQIKSRYTFDEWKEILTEAQINNFTITPYIESVDLKKDIVKSGLDKLLLIEIQFEK